MFWLYSSLILFIGSNGLNETFREQAIYMLKSKVLVFEAVY